MVLDELKVPFRWYENISYKVAQLPECDGHRYKLITPYDRLLPFQFRFESDGGIPHLPVSFEIFNAADNTLAFTATIQPLNYYHWGIWDYIIYNGEAIADMALPTGFYYAVVTLADGYRTLYSEDFWIDCDDDGRIVMGDFSDDFNDDFGPADASGGLRKYTKLEWWNDCDLGNILYQTGYKNILYVESNLQRGEPTIVEEGSEDGNKDFIVTSMKYIDKILLDEYLPEFVLTAILPIRLHNNVLVTTQRNGYTGKAKAFNTDFSWINDCYAITNISFNQETTFLRRNCCNNNSIVDYYRCATAIANLTVTQSMPGHFDLNWQLTDGTNPEFEVVSSSINGGAPQSTGSTTSFNSGNVVDSVITGIVRGKCVNPDNGRISYGNELPFFVELDVCSTPTGLAVDLITDDGATATWADMGAGSTYDVTIATAAAPGVPLAGYPQATTGLQHVFTGLDPETDYIIKVRKDCGYQESAYAEVNLTTFG